MDFQTVVVIASIAVAAFLAHIVRGLRRKGGSCCGDGGKYPHCKG